jgi:uncharacterized membrane protein
MLVVFPIGLWIFSLVCDILYHAGPHNLFWEATAFYTMLGGVIGAVLAAVPGFIDYLSIRDARTKKIATTHLILNLVVVALFIFNLGVRLNAPPDGVFSLILSILGVGILAISGWLGGSLVYVHRVAVAPVRTEERRAA